nr:putative DC1, C1-like, Zinc finger, RING/FYVE/PHD-type [Ipomoea batatas]
MEFKHFSHNHGLVFHQMPQGAQIQCSGCHCPGTGPVYACWRCSFFLHDQCFRASRSLKHPSHHLHPLTLTPYPTYPSNSFYCNSCTLIGSGFSYSCSECDFDLHVHCAHSHIPNQSIPCTHPNPNPNPNPIPSFSPPTSAPAAASPSVHSPAAPEPEPPVGFPTGKDRETTHFSHPHRLKLTEVQENDGKKCSGCEYIVTGPVYTCVDPDCGVDFNLHKKCFELPREVRHNSHLDHALTLLPSPPYQDGDGFACNACLQKGSAFVYHCGACSFDLHVECVRWPEKVQRDDHKHALSLFYAPPVQTKKDGEEAAAEEKPPVDKPEDDDGAAAAAAIQEAQMKLALLQLLVNGGGPIEFTFS